VKYEIKFKVRGFVSTQYLFPLLGLITFQHVFWYVCVCPYIRTHPCIHTYTFYPWLRHLTIFTSNPPLPVTPWKPGSWHHTETKVCRNHGKSDATQSLRNQVHYTYKDIQWFSSNVDLKFHKLYTKISSNSRKTTDGGQISIGRAMSTILTSTYASAYKIPQIKTAHTNYRVDYQCKRLHNKAMTSPM
jgi:hypothetical protein